MQSGQDDSFDDIAGQQLLTEAQQEEQDPGRLGLHPDDRIGPYTLVRPLGAGGMAVVWEAARSDGTFDRRVALKLPRRHLWRVGDAERFARERQLLARLEHPNIARLYDAGVAPPGGPLEGSPFLVLEYVEGSHLTHYCESHQLGTRARLELFQQVLDAVQYAHTRLVIHRDLKPANILVTAEGRVRLLDFGIGKLIRTDESERDGSVTLLTGKPYTPDYASPEQVRGEDLTTASDVYTLGVVLYQLLSDAPPYAAEDGVMGHIEWAILDCEPLPPSLRANADSAARRACSLATLRRELRGELDTIVLKALEKQPARRYVTVAALAEDLRRHLAGERVLARPDSWLYRARKYAMRNKVAAGSALAIVLALGVGLGVALWQADRAQRALAQAVQLSQRNAAVNNFLGTMLSGATLTEHLTVGQLLSQTEDTIDRQFAHDPATRAAVRSMVANYYSDAGLYAKGSQLWQRARADARLSGQADLIALAECLGAANDVALGKAGGALAQVRAALALPGLADHERALCRYAASEIDYMLGDLGGALRDARQAIDTLSTVAERYPMEHAELTGWLATVWGANNRDDLAETLHRDALAQLHRLGRDRDTAAVVIANNYAVLMTRIRPREAVATLSDLRQRFERSAAGTPMPAYLLVNYGFALLNAGDPHAALEVAKDPVLQDNGREWSEERPQRELIRARAYSDLGNYVAAHAALDRAAALIAAAPSLVTPPNSMLSIKARLAFREGHVAEALNITESLLVPSHGTGPEGVGISRRLLAEIRLQQGDLDAAERQARSNLARTLAVQGRNAWSLDTGRDWDVLGRVLARRQQMGPAREAFGQARAHFAHTVLPTAQILVDLDLRLAATADIAVR